jgi:NOL1/NOP2/sun family putative RNA methylase
MLPALILNPGPNELVIDMCAAPGGKATHLAQIMNNEGNLTLFERNQKRIPALETNLQRMGVINSIIVNDDAENLPNLNIKADKILLDAPCTGEGLIRQDPSRKKSKKMKDINKLSKIQKRLLEIGLKSLKTGGELLYSTCSIGPEENELVVNDILNSLSAYEIRELPNPFGENGLTEVYGRSLRADLSNSRRIYPHIHDTIGFFLCLIKKVK